MSHLRSVATLVMLATVAGHAHAQQPTETKRMTLSFRTPSWFGLAVECGTCLTVTATPGARPMPVITQITPGGPAARASLQVGDTIIAVDGKEVLAADLPKTLSSAPPGTTIKLAVGTRRGRATVSMTSEKA